MRHLPEQSLFEVDTPHGAAYVSYEGIAGGIDLTYTFVPPEARGSGLGARLVRDVRAWARDQHLTVTASCGFAARVLARLP